MNLATPSNKSITFTIGLQFIIAKTALLKKFFLDFYVLLEVSGLEGLVFIERSAWTDHLNCTETGAVGKRPKEKRQDRNGQPRESLLAGLPASAQFPQLSGTAALSDVGHLTERQKLEEYYGPDS